MKVDPTCDFCRIATFDESSLEILRTNQVVAFFPLKPATLGHSLVIPREHIPELWTLDDDTAHALIDSTLRIARAVRAAMRPEGLNIIQSNGAAATQTVAHLHVHVLPRWRGDAIGPIWPTRSVTSEESLRQAYQSIRTVLTGQL